MHPCHVADAPVSQGEGLPDIFARDAVDGETRLWCVIDSPLLALLAASYCLLAARPTISRLSQGPNVLVLGKSPIEEGPSAGERVLAGVYTRTLFLCECVLVNLTTPMVKLVSTVGKSASR